MKRELVQEVNRLCLQFGEAEVREAWQELIQLNRKRAQYEEVHAVIALVEEKLHYCPCWLESRRKSLKKAMLALEVECSLKGGD